jgi:hypothetical protein
MQGVANYKFLASKISADYTTRLEVYTREMKIDLDAATREGQKKMETNVEVLHVIDDVVKIEVIPMTDLSVDQLKAVNKALGIFFYQNLNITVGNIYVLFLYII